MLITQWRGEQRRTYRTGCLKHPSDTSRRGIESLHQSTGAAHEELAIKNRGLRESDDVTIKTIRPFQFEPRHLGEGQAGRINGLVSRIRCVRTPSIPLRLPSARQLDVAVRTVRCCGR